MGLGLFAFCIVRTNSRVSSLVSARKGKETFTDHGKICSGDRAEIQWVGVGRLRIMKSLLNDSGRTRASD